MRTIEQRTDCAMLTERAERGAEVLTKYFGDTTWADDINLDTLSIPSIFNCVLGQLWEFRPGINGSMWGSGYGRGIGVLEVGGFLPEGSDAVNYGFAGGDSQTAAWKPVIIKARQPTPETGWAKAPETGWAKFTKKMLSLVACL